MPLIFSEIGKIETQSTSFHHKTKIKSNSIIWYC